MDFIAHKPLRNIPEVVTAIYGLSDQNPTSASSLLHNMLHSVLFLKIPGGEGA
jgi:hypothetical protein